MSVQRVLSTLGLPVILIIAFTVFTGLSDSFLTAANLESMILSFAISALMFLGLTWVFTIGEMDVSFVAVAALANMITAGLVIAGYSWGAATTLAMLAAFAIGVLNGVLIAKLGLPSLVTTIATGGMASALAAAIGKGSSMGIDQPGYLQVLFDVRFGIVSLLVVLIVVLVALCWYVQERLTLGHYIFSMATNPAAAREAGIPTARITIMLCVFAALCSGVAGILLAVQLSSGQPSIAQSLFLDGLTAVLLGGTMLKIGKPNILGTIVGVAIIAVLIRGGALLGWSDASFSTIKGLLLLFGVTIVVWTGRKPA
ncbi:ABC transporter permease [uncultured Tateyamaria sp.]|uniref:ABC transporter permease n=1 Tax=uncultured Tateyamaria sp. TaxID=455651 RepID=UPI0026018A20|nr:ABC transporter permease [uncultured Tateyamaria sp.]